MTGNWKLKAAISGGAVLAILARIIWPDVRVDSITLGLVLIAVLPWISELIESAKFPGGWEIKFRPLQTAGDKLTKETSGPEAPSPEPSFVAVAEKDPNLALVGLRIEIEKRMRELASLSEVTEDRSLARLTRSLAREGVIPPEIVGALEEIIAAGNRAAHGASVEPSAGEWAVTEGPKILAALDSLRR